MDVKELHKQFCTEEFDEYGVISKFEIHCPVTSTLLMMLLTSLRRRNQIAGQ